MIFLRSLQQDQPQLRRPVRQREAQPLQIGMTGAKLILDGRDLAAAALHSSCPPGLQQPFDRSLHHLSELRRVHQQPAQFKGS